MILRIARHGETTWNAVGRYQGRLETPLSPLGQAQAQALAGALRESGIGRIVSSPLSRCVQTAVPLATVTGVRIETDPRLTEIGHGAWEGRYRSEIQLTEPELYREWREHPERVRFSGGESLSDVLARWASFAADLAEDVDTLVLTHDVVIRVAVLAQTGRGLERLREVRAVNAAYAEFEVTGGVWRLNSECVDGHLAHLAADVERQAL